jgi:hypothetical protein
LIAGLRYKIFSTASKRAPLKACRRAYEDMARAYQCPAYISSHGFRTRPSSRRRHARTISKPSSVFPMRVGHSFDSNMDDPGRSVASGRIPFFENAKGGTPKTITPCSFPKLFVTSRCGPPAARFVASCAHGRVTGCFAYPSAPGYHVPLLRSCGCGGLAAVPYYACCAGEDARAPWWMRCLPGIGRWAQSYGRKSRRIPL